MELPWWIVSVVWLAGYAVIWSVVLAFALQYRSRKPKAARLFFAALRIAALQWMLRLAQIVISTLWTDAISYNDDGPDWSNPYLVYMVVLQFIHAACDIASWSLLAWAALMRPDESRRRRSE